jgi:hypothetical protein
MPEASERGAITMAAHKIVSQRLSETGRGTKASDLRFYYAGGNDGEIVLHEHGTMAHLVVETVTKEDTPEGAAARILEKIDALIPRREEGAGQ